MRDKCIRNGADDAERTRRKAELDALKAAHHRLISECNRLRGEHERLVADHDRMRVLGEEHAVLAEHQRLREEMQKPLVQTQAPSKHEVYSPHAADQDLPCTNSSSVSHT